MNLSTSPHTASKRIPAVAVLLLMALYTVYAAALIFQSSFVVDGTRVFCLLDDPMISMRYAWNLAQGNGLVWNPGERVEGITNPGWTFIMALVHLWEPDKTVTSLYMQIISLLCNLVSAAAILGIVKALGRSFHVGLCAAALYLFYFPMNYWSLYGMETGLLAMLLNVALWIYFRKKDTPRAWLWPYLILGLGTYVRLDIAVAFIALSVYDTFSRRDIKQQLTRCLVPAAILGFFIGSQTLARLAYYGYPFPNTYYLKMTGFPVLQRMARGGMVTIGSVLNLILPVIAMLVFLGVWSLLQRGTRIKNGSIHPVLWVIIFAQVVYSIYVGGDAWEDDVFFNRYLVIVYGAVSVLFAISLYTAVCSVSCVFVKPNVLAAAIVLVAIGAINFNALSPTVRRDFALKNQSIVSRESRNSYINAAFFNDAAPDTRIATDWAGGMAYFSDHYMIDLLGKCDVQIAGQIVKRKAWNSPRWEKAFYPGHQKWDAEYTIDYYKPDYIVSRFAPFVVTEREIIESEYELVSAPSGHFNGLLFASKKATIPAF